MSIPHFGMAFVGAGAIAAAAAAFLGFSIARRSATFVVVMIVSLVALRSSLVGYLGGQGRAVAHRSARRPRMGSSRTTSIRRSAPAASTSAAKTGRRAAPRPIAAGMKVRVTGADGIVLEVTRT